MHSLFRKMKPGESKQLFIMTYKWNNKIQQSSIILESTIKLKFYKVNKTV